MRPKDNYGKEFECTLPILESKEKKGLKARQPEITKAMQLDLNDIKYHVEPTKTKKTGMFSKKTKQRSPEEIFMLS